MSYYDQIQSEEYNLWNLWTLLKYEASVIHSVNENSGLKYSISNQYHLLKFIN